MFSKTALKYGAIGAVMALVAIAYIPQVRRFIKIT